MRPDTLPARDTDGGSTHGDALAGKVVLVTGARGFLGSRLSTRLDGHGARVIRLGRDSSHREAPVTRGAASWDVTADVREPGLWARLPAVPDVIFHLAAQTSVAVAEDDPGQDWRANVQPLLQLLETCREKGWRPGILFAGSVTQVGI